MMQALKTYNLKATRTASVKAYRAKLQADIKKLQALLGALDDDIRAGHHDDAFALVPAPVSMYVPKDLWVSALGEEWVSQNEKPMNKKPVIVAK